jgi:hypothetical protein
VFTAAATWSAAQTPDSLSFRRAFFLELGGNGGTYLLGFERRFNKVLPGHLRWQVGTSVTPLGQTFFDLHAGINYTRGKVHQAEAGMGHLFVVDLTGGKGANVRFTFRFGYRLDPWKRRMYFKAAYTPFVSYIYNLQYEHFAGLTVGYKF